MLVLALDSALNACSAALIEGDATRAVRTLPMSQGHAEHLAPMVKDLLGEAQVGVSQLDRIGVVAGPGQFAGVRIGLAFALGLATGGRARVLGFSSLEALALGAGEDWTRPRAVAIDARRGEVYAALFGAPGRTLVAPFVASVNEARARLTDAGGAAADVIGTGASLVAAGGARVDPRGAIDPVALARRAAAADPDAHPARPLYLRAPDAAPAAASRFRPT